ncbi:MAG: glutathione peroxidase [Pseudobdellovibrionaceae bacterium]
MKNIVLTLMGCVLAFTGFSSHAHAQQETAPQMTPANAYQFSFQTIDGKDMPLSDYKGQVVLVVNTASQCGFTKQYAGLEKLYETYKDKGFTVIGVPCNQFGGQEPGTGEEIKAFAKNEYGITFPLTAKANVKGDNAHPFFTWAAEQNKGGFLSSSPKWNFHKYLIDREGQLYRSYGSTTAPDDSDLAADIEKLLQAPEN